MQTADWLRTIVFRVRKQWDYCCHVLICMVKTIVRSLRFTLTGYFFKLKSSIQFDGGSESWKFCKRLRDTAPLAAEANNYEASNCQTVRPVGKAFRQTAKTKEYFIHSSLLFKFFLTVQISCWLFSDKPVVGECSKTMFSMFIFYGNCCKNFGFDRRLRHVLDQLCCQEYKARWILKFFSVVLCFSASPESCFWVLVCVKRKSKHTVWRTVGLKCPKRL